MDAEARYLEHFGLEFNPFPVAPDVENFFISDSIERLVTEMVHAVLTRKGFMVLTGEVGLGKTTISRKIMGILKEEGVETSLVFHTAYKDVELLREINRDFGLQSDEAGFGDQMKLLNDFLLERNREGKNCAIIIDDAQNLDLESFELVRMISNLETDRQKLVQILFVGQPELARKLERPELRQLKSRVIIRRETRPLDRAELYNYLLFKFNAAGNRGKIMLHKAAARKIHRLSRGNFREVNVLMDRCLYAAFLLDTTAIDRRVVKTAYRDLQGERSPARRRNLAWAGAAGLAAVALAAGIYWQGKRTPPVMASLGSVSAVEQAASITPAGRSGTMIPPVKHGAEKEIQAPASGDSPKSSDPLSLFLQGYGLERYGPDFRMALATRRLQGLAEKIFGETGLRLLQLPVLPPRARELYGVYAAPEGEGGKESFLLFWKPPFQLPACHFGLRSPEVASLQRLLTRAGLYHEKADGVFGGKTWEAVLAYQSSAGLPRTGFPDLATLFLLLHSEERKTAS